MSKKKSKCKMDLQRDNGMWMVTCTQHGLKHHKNGMQWYSHKNEAKTYIKEHLERYAQH